MNRRSAPTQRQRWTAPGTCGRAQGTFYQHFPFDILRAVWQQSRHSE
jgi:hypothetical protein